MERIPITRTSRIRLKVRNNFGAAITLGVRGYSGRSDFTQQTFGETRFTPAHTDGTLDIMTIGQYITPFSDPSFIKGYLYNVALYIVSPVSGVKDKQVYVTCELLSTASDGVLARTLFSGYVTSNVAIGYPQTGIHTSFEGLGFNLIQQSLVPLAQTFVRYTSPANVMSKVISFLGYYTTGATVAGNQRNPTVIYSQGSLAVNGNIIPSIDFFGDGISQIRVSCGVIGVTPYTINDPAGVNEKDTYIPLPQELFLYPNDFFEVAFINGDDTVDSWLQYSMIVQTWIIN